MPASIADSLTKGFAITPPSLGRITIGHLEDAGDGQKHPVRDDCIHLTSTAKLADGSWAPHPLQEKLLAERGNERKTDGQRILREIPVRVVYDRHDLNIRTRFTAFDRATGRVMCTGNGESARRRAAQGGEGGSTGPTQQVACVGPETCPYGLENGCKPYTRLHVRIEGQGDALGVFTLRTTGWNSARALHYKLATLSALAGGEPAGTRMKLVIRARASQMSTWTNFYYMDLVAEAKDGDEIAALEQAVAERQRFRQQAALEEMAGQLLANGAFETTAEDCEEFEELAPLSGPLATGHRPPPGSKSVNSEVSAIAHLASTGEIKGLSGLDSLRQSLGVATTQPLPPADLPPYPTAISAMPRIKALNFENDDASQGDDVVTENTTHACS
jgi:hypothetical protein